MPMSYGAPPPAEGVSRSGKAAPDPHGPRRRCAGHNGAQAAFQDAGSVDSQFSFSQ